MRLPAIYRCLGVAALLTAIALVGCAETPQLNGDERSLGAADALWTAVTAKDPKLVDAAASAIEGLHNAASLPDDAYAVLTGVIATTKAGDWSGAREDLKAFVQGQRRQQAP